MSTSLCEVQYVAWLNFRWDNWRHCAAVPVFHLLIIEYLSCTNDPLDLIAAGHTIRFWWRKKTDEDPAMTLLCGIALYKALLCAALLPRLMSMGAVGACVDGWGEQAFKPWMLRPTRQSFTERGACNGSKMGWLRINVCVSSQCVIWLDGKDSSPYFAPAHLSSFLTLQSNPFPSISGLKACHWGPWDQYLPSLNHRIICLSWFPTEALYSDINLGLSSTIWEGHTSKHSLLYCTPEGWIK